MFTYLLALSWHTYIVYILRERRAKLLAGGGRDYVITVANQNCPVFSVKDKKKNLLKVGHISVLF